MPKIGQSTIHDEPILTTIPQVKGGHGGIVVGYPATLQERAEWATAKLDIGLYTTHEGKAIQRGVKKVSGKVFGYVAVYQCDCCEPPHWHLFAVPSDHWILTVPDEDEAKKIGEVLQAKCCLALREKDSGRVNDRIAKWVPGWIRQCKVEKKYVDPAPLIAVETAC